jgi:hypothetical protein
MPITAQIDGIGNLEFPDGTSPDVVHATVQKVVMQHNAPKPLTGAVPGGNDGVPTGLSGPKDPEYKPFFSSDEARDEGSGILKAGAGVLGHIAHGVSHIPGGQGLKDLDEYAKPANKGETFGKVAGTGLGAIGALALPPVAGAITTAGDFGGGLMEGAASELSPVLGRVLPSAKTLGKLALGGGSTADLLWNLYRHLR